MGKKKKKYISEENFNEKNLNFFYGIPHCHTGFSTGRGSPLEALEYGKNKNLDFMIITDHNKYLDEIDSSSKNHLTRWKISKSIIEKFNKKHENFIALLGFETKSSPWGHLNIINTSSFFNGVVKNLNSLALWLMMEGNSIVSINHPQSSIINLPSPSLYNKFINSIEVANGSYPNKYNKYYKNYFSMLDRGWKLSAINSQDNHRINFGDRENLTAIICSNKLTKESLIDSFKNGRTYSTESKTLKFYFKINDSFMGSTLYLKENDILNFYIYCEDSRYPIEKIYIYSNGGRLLKEVSNLSLNNVKYMIKLPYIIENNWYVIKLKQKGKKEALSSPIYIYEKDD